MRYRKINPRIWNDAKFRALSSPGKLAFFLLLTHPQTTAIGTLRATPAGLEADLEGFAEGFAEALAKGMAKACSDPPLIYLPNFLRYNPPESPNCVKAWVWALAEIPECALHATVISGVKAFAEGLPEGFRKALPEGFAKGMPIPEPEPEPEPEQLTTSFDQPATAPVDPVTAFETVWKAYPRKIGKPKSAILATRLVKTGKVTWEQLAGVVERYAEAVAGKEPQYILHGPTFFGPNGRWHDYLNGHPEPVASASATDMHGERYTRPDGMNDDDWRIMQDRGGEPLPGWRERMASNAR